MTGPTPQDMRALAAQHASAAHREQFGGDECWYESTAAALRAAADQLEIVQGILQSGHQQGEQISSEKFAKLFPELVRSVRCERCAAPIFKQGTRWIDPMGNDAHHVGGSDWEAHMPPWKADA